ncbi:hypothetical protein J2Z23_002026 [Lederbergia galactosidilyticus]|nr:hypothetical protein [Lederbergia galactosidilytica]
MLSLKSEYCITLAKYISGVRYIHANSSDFTQAKTLLY